MTRETTSAITVPIPRQSMAQLVGMEPAAPPEPCDITYTCEEPHVYGRCCTKCDGHGYRTATVTPRFVLIAGLAYERGQIDGTAIEDLETISDVLDRVDEECRPRLEWLLYHDAPEVRCFL